MVIERKGCTRIVFIFDKFVIKLPNIVFYRLFLCGLLANMQEAQFGRSNLEGFCPVLFAFPGGWFLVAKRATEMTVEQFLNFDAKAFCERDTYYIPAEHKACSFGYLNGKVVAIDYG